MSQSNYVLNMRSAMFSMTVLLASLLIITITDVAASTAPANPMHCPGLSIPNGRVNIRARGRTAKFVCLSGYQLLGRRYITCVRGRWNDDPPMCITRGCPTLVPSPHSQMSPNMRGALMRFKCDPGYEISAWPVVACDGVRWNTTAPTCENLLPNPPLICNFELEDLCGWSHDTTDHFDWKRFSSSTPSGHIGTGPSHDHTYGTDKDGYYLYIEASSPRKENDEARLFSPVFSLSQLGNDSCFLLWYHMFGSAIGTLNIYLKTESKDFASLSPSWNRSGDHGNQWNLAVIQLVDITEDLQIVVEGIRGSGYSSDIAIDDASIGFGSECEEPVTATPDWFSSDGPTSSTENSQLVDSTTFISDIPSSSQAFSKSSEEPMWLSTTMGSEASTDLLGSSAIQFLSTETPLSSGTGEAGEIPSTVSSKTIPPITTAPEFSTEAPSSSTSLLISTTDILPPSATEANPPMTSTAQPTAPTTTSTTLTTTTATTTSPTTTATTATTTRPTTTTTTTIPTTTTTTTIPTTTTTTTIPTTTTTTTRPTTTTTTTRPTTMTTTTRPTTITTTTRPTTTTTATRATTTTTTTRATTTTTTTRPTTTTTTTRPTTTTTRPTTTTTTTRPTTTTTTTTRPTTTTTTTRPTTTTRRTTTTRTRPITKKTTTTRPPTTRTTPRRTPRTTPARRIPTTKPVTTSRPRPIPRLSSTPFVQISQTPTFLPYSPGITSTDMPNDIVTALPTIDSTKKIVLPPWVYMTRTEKPNAVAPSSPDMDNNLHPSARLAQTVAGGSTVPVPVAIAIALGVIVSLIVIVFAGRSIYRRRKAKQDNLMEDSDVRYLTEGEVRVEFFDRN